MTTNASGAMTSQMRYKAWGEVRFASGTNPTKYTYTGQCSNVSDFGLMFYNARWYDPVSGRFASADTIVPAGVQGLDRYTYVNNSPVNYTDPTGHDVDCGIGDQFCSDLKHEMANSDWQKHLSFKRFINARDAYYYYYNHPDKAIDADLNLDGDYNVGLSYTLGSIYSEDVLHQAFQPYGMDTLFDRIEVERKADNGVAFWSLVINLNISFGNDGGNGGGGGRGSSPDDILMPGGSPIGIQQGKNPAFRTVQSEQELREIFNALTMNGIPDTPSAYKGVGYTLPNGGWVGLRQSAGFGLTMDVKIPGIPIVKIHLPMP